MRRHAFLTINNLREVTPFPWCIECLGLPFMDETILTAGIFCIRDRIIEPHVLCLIEVNNDLRILFTDVFRKRNDCIHLFVSLINDQNPTTDDPS